jgi:hypothetical protein
MLGGWIGVAEFARRADPPVPPKTMLRRLKALERMAGVRLLRSKHQPGRKPRKWWVHPERAEAALEKDPDARTATVEDLCVRLESLEKKHTALKNSFKRACSHGNLAKTA